MVTKKRSPKWAILSELLALVDFTTKFSFKILPTLLRSGQFLSIIDPSPTLLHFTAKRTLSTNLLLLSSAKRCRHILLTTPLCTTIDNGEFFYYFASKLVTPFLPLAPNAA